MEISEGNNVLMEFDYFSNNGMGKCTDLYANYLSSFFYVGNTWYGCGSREKFHFVKDERYNYDTIDRLNFGNNVKKIVGGMAHTLVLTKDGRVYSFGRNVFGALGCKVDRRYPSPEDKDISKLLIYFFETPETKVIKDVQCGDYFSMAITNKNEVFVFGSGGVGVGCDNDSFYTPQKIEIKNKIIERIGSTNFLGIYITNENECYVCGSYESLIHKSFVPIKITNESVLYAKGGFKNIIFLTTSGLLLGIENEKNRNTLGNKKYPKNENMYLLFHERLFVDESQFFKNLRNNKEYDTKIICKV